MMQIQPRGVMVRPSAPRKPETAAPQAVQKPVKPAPVTGGSAGSTDAKDWLTRFSSVLFGGFERVKDAVQDLLPGKEATATVPARVAADVDTAAERHDQRNAWFMSQTHGAYNPAEDTWGNSNCGPTSLAMIAKAFGKLEADAKGADAAIEDARRRMGQSQNERDYTSTTGLVAGAKSYGLTASTKTVSSLAEIQSELAANRMVIASVVPKYLGPLASGGHFTVVTKIEGDKVYLNDPWKSSGPIVVSAAEFWDSLKSRTSTIVSVGR